MDGDHHSLGHFRDWMRKGMTGCTFAASFAGEGRINYLHLLDDLSDAEVAEVDEFIDVAAGGNNFAVILFPRLRTPRGIVRVLRTLMTGERWRAERVAWRKHPREGAALVGLHFRTSTGDQTSVMGFAPLGCMPVTRRAPYVALALWAGTKAKQYKPSPEGSLGFTDAPVFDSNGATVDANTHRSMWDATMGRAKELLGDPPEDDFKLKDVAFCLPETNVAELFPA